jgi:predicted ester cyclase
MKRSRELFRRVTLLGLLAVLIAGLWAVIPVRTADGAPASANQAVVEEYFANVLSQGDEAAAAAVLVPEFQRIDRSQSGATLGAQGMLFLANYQLSAFEDLRYTIDALVVVGDQVAVCWTATGTQTGAYGVAAATGKPVTWTGMSFLQLKDGKIAGEVTNLEDLAGVLNAGGLHISPSYLQ